MLSVVICTHNPRRDFLSSVLRALRQQSYPLDDWELLIIDNASAEPLGAWLEIEWHPRARVVREDEIGLTPARLRGIAETKGNVLVFVDDDNILGADYLTKVAEVAREFPHLAAWGAGQISPEFEEEPEPVLAKHMGLLAILTSDKDVWSNNSADETCIPYGAGLCVRRNAAQLYSRNCSTDSLARFLDRRGSFLLSGGDILLALTGAQMGLGWGRFFHLGITHLIPATRVREEYLLDLREKMTASHCLVRYLETGSYLDPLERWPGKIRHAYHLARLLATARWSDWRFYRANIRGYHLASDLIASVKASTPESASEQSTERAKLQPPL